MKLQEEFHQDRLPLPVNDNILPVMYPDSFDYAVPEKEEKYITYLPHSGFHNQRIELENALLLASYLN
ncbi:hypothetical protein ABG067_008594, partial [Albugo candida]